MPAGPGRANIYASVALAGFFLASCAETKFLPPSPEIRQRLAVTSVRSLPDVQPSEPQAPVEGAGRAALTGAGQGAAIGFLTGAVACAGGPLLCGLGVVAGAAFAVVGAPIGAIVGAARAHSAQDVRIADASLRAALGQLRPSAMLRDKIVAAAREKTRYDLRPEEAPLGKAQQDLNGHDLASVMELAVSQIELVSAGRIDPESSLMIIAEIRLKDRASGAELYQRKWAYLGKQQKYFDMAAQNGALLRRELQTGIDRLADRIVFDLLITSAPERKVDGRPGDVWTIEAPELKASPISPAVPGPSKSTSSS